MGTDTARHAGGRPAGFWRTPAGRRVIALFYAEVTPETVEALWGSAVRLAAEGNPVDSVAARVVGVSRRTWARWRRFTVAKGYPVLRAEISVGR